MKVSPQDTKPFSKYIFKTQVKGLNSLPSLILQGVGSKQVQSRSEKIPVSTAAIIAKYLDDVKKP